MALDLLSIMSKNGVSLLTGFNVTRIYTLYNPNPRSETQSFKDHVRPLLNHPTAKGNPAIKTLLKF